MNYPATPWGILFAFSGLYFNLIFIVGAIYLYARVPFMERWQMYQLIRLGRQKWIGIQIFKIVAASFLYTAAVLASGVLIMMPHLEWKADWGKLYHTLALTNVQDEIDLGFFVSYRLINDYEPAKLMLISALVFFLVVSFIGLTMFLISLCFSRAVSVIMATSLAIAEIAVENAGGTPQRIMDIMGAGGFVLTSYCEETAELFEEDKEIVMFRTPEELLEKVDYYLAHDRERRRIAERGFKKVMERYTYENKMQEITEWLKRDGE